MTRQAWHLWQHDSDGWKIAGKPATEQEVRDAMAQMAATTARLMPEVEWLALPEGQAPTTRDDTDHSRVGIPNGD